MTQWTSNGGCQCQVMVSVSSNGGRQCQVGVDRILLRSECLQMEQVYGVVPKCDTCAEELIHIQCG